METKEGEGSGSFILSSLSLSLFLQVQPSWGFGENCGEKYATH